MKLIICAVFDSATAAYMQPFFARTAGEAIRSFTEAANAEDHQFSRHADDYTLFQIGSFDDASGQLEPVAPMSLGNALEYRRPKARAPQLEIGEVTRG